MPLSEHEQRLLEEMERSLYHNDADFVAAVGNRGGRRNYRTIVIGLLLALVGVAVIIAGVAIREPLIGVVGFVVMFVGVLLAFSRPRQENGPSADDSSPAAARPGFMDRLNERWDKRQDDSDR
jgi:uncharacterized membrane protein